MLVKMQFCPRGNDGQSACWSEKNLRQKRVSVCPANKPSVFLMSAMGQMRAALRGEGVSACPSKADVEGMRRTRQLWATIRSLNLASPLIEVVHRAPASRVARWLTGEPCGEARLPQSADAGWFDLCRVSSSSRSLHTIGVAIMQRRTRSAQPEEGVEIT